MTFTGYLWVSLCRQGQQGGEPPLFDAWAAFLNFLPELILVLIVVAVAIIVYRALRRQHPAPAAREVLVEREVVTLVVCPHCGAKNLQGARRCSECGATL